MKKYKVFLASSGELTQERKEIALMISRQNNAWVEKDVYLELVIWEDLLHSFRGESIQDYFNRKMLECDIVIVLFFKKVGPFTEEEFKLAYKNLEEGKKPHYLFVYFRSGTIALDEVDEEILKINKLKKEIQKYEQLYGSFNSIEDLTQRLRHQLEMAILEKVGEPGWEKEAENLEKQRDDLETYKKYIIQRFQYLDFTGLNSILKSPLKLEKIYVKLRAQKLPPSSSYLYSREFEHFAAKVAGNIPVFDFYKKKKLEISEPPVEDFLTIFNHLLEESSKLGCPPCMLILGNPGSGKTTLVKWIALQCLTVNSINNVFSNFLPVFIPLKKLGSDPDGTFRKKNIVNLVTHLSEGDNITVSSFLDHYLRTNRLLFLMDGLDEIGDEKIRRKVIDWIQEQYTGQNPVIVTSRFSAIHNTSGLKFKDDVPVFAIQDFTMEDVDAFLKNWYGTIEIAVAGEEVTQLDVEEREKKYEGLINTIIRSRNLIELAINPLLLSIIAIVHRTRAVLPRDRHKLYEECLKVMIELWNLANRKIDVSFSFDNSMAHLSKIAVQLMETNRREMVNKEVETCLPHIIEGETREFFLKEMVLKAGLLFESEGKYGFLHLTFQEYLAARYFAKSKRQNEILKHHNKDYWKETFKLFVNIGNAELFFDEIIEQLMEKKYWQHIMLWEDCMKEIVVEETRETIGLKFAKKVIDILSKIKYNERNDKLINAFLWFDALYQQADQMEAEAWDLFYNAPHPFVQSIGSSILYKSANKTQAELMDQLRNRIETFEKRIYISGDDRLYFMLQNNNSLALLFAGRTNLADLHFALMHSKSGDIFLQYLLFRGLLLLLSLPALKNIRGIMDIRDILNIMDIRGILDIEDIRILKALGSRGILNNSDIMNIRDIRDIRGVRDMRILIGVQYYKNSLVLYNKKYKSTLKKRQKEIADWTDRALEKLHAMPDNELLEYFPHTSIEELNAFRESNK